MRIFYNPRDRKNLEANEHKAPVATVNKTKYERMEPTSTGSSSTESKQEKEEEKETGEATAKKTGKKKTEPLL